MKGIPSLLLCAALALLSACDGSDDASPPAAGNPPVGQPPGSPSIGTLTAVVTPATGGSLPSTMPVLVQFSGQVAPASLQLGGSFMALGPTPRWSADGATLTLDPPSGGWPRGQGGVLSVQATGSSGATMTGPVLAKFIVPLLLANGQAALAAVGQADLSTSNAQAANGRSARTLVSPVGGVAITPDGRLLVGDNVNHRILGFASLPLGSDAVADLVLGQPDFATGVAGTARGAYTRPQQVTVQGGRMAAVDYSNHRVLVWNSVPSASGALPDVVIGQPDFNAASSACGPSGLNFAETALLTPDGKLIVADTENNRVLVWLEVPATNAKPADLVIGQSTFTRCTGNDDDQNGVRDAAPSPRTLRRPTGIWSDGQRLVVVDSNNHRVLLWPSFPTGNFQPATLVLGQETFTRATSNDDNQDGASDAAPTSRTLSDPWAGVSSNGVQLAVADSGNNRVLVWNTFPATNFQPADVVLGQPDFSARTSATAAGRMNYPAGVLFHQDKLLVTDRFNNRVLVLQSP